MPEGPEIRRVSDRLREALEGEIVESVEFGLPRLSPFAQRLAGARVERVNSRGKAMLIRFGCALTLYSHNQLYGRWYVVDRGDTPTTMRSLRVALHTRRQSALLYSASDISVLDDAQVRVHPFLTRLGPDILDPDVDWRLVAARLDEKRFRGRALSSLYLDQSFLAGVGNYLRSEIIYFTGLPPRIVPGSLSTRQRNELARQTLAVSRRSYTSGGITNLPARVARLRKAGIARGDYRFAVFGRDSLPCYACGDIVRRVDAASRRLYYCPACQGC